MLGLIVLSSAQVGLDHAISANFDARGEKLELMVLERI
jgi:hypothetical protein